MAKKRKVSKRKARAHGCATMLGRRGGKKTLSLGHGIFADVYKRKKSKRRKKRK